MDFDKLFFDPNADCEHSKSKLPHIHQPEKLQFVTFRLADSLPVSVRTLIDAQMKAFEMAHPKPWNQSIQQLFNAKFRPALQKLLDKGYGECILKNPQVRQIVVNAINYYNDNNEIEFFDYVIMPNHVHLLATFSIPPEVLIGKLRKFTSRVINTLLHRTGTIWDREVWDRYIRNHTHLTNTRCYIQDNPRFLPPTTYTLFISPI